MPLFTKILFLVPQIFFWSAVLSYVPVALFLILHPLFALKAEQERNQGIFIIKAELQLACEQAARVKGAWMIYGCCVGIFILVAAYNGVVRSDISLFPLDVVSTAAIVFFGISVVTYIPALYYTLYLNPWRFKPEGLCLRKLFVGYGLVLLIFAMAFVLRWLESRHMLVGVGELAWMAFVIACGGAALSYLPILSYILFNSLKFRQRKGLRPAVIFLIYCVCFLIYSGVYSYYWVQIHAGRGRAQPKILLFSSADHARPNFSVEGSRLE